MRAAGAACLVLLGASIALLASASAAAQNEVVVGALPAYAFEDRSWPLAWEVRLDGATPPSNITDSAAFFDTTAHGSPPTDFGLYPSRAAGVTVDGTNFTANVTAPAGAGALYLIVIANISGVTVYNASEWSVAFRVQPVAVLNASASTSTVFVNRNWTARVDVSWPYGDAFDEVRIAWDSSPHGGPPQNASAYPNSSAPQAGVAGPFNFVIPAGGAAVRFFFVATVSEGGTVFVSTAELNVSVVPEPILSRDAASPWVFVGRPAAVSWSVVWPSTASYPLTEVRWDSVSHFPGSPGDYPNSAGAAAGVGSASFTTPITAPGAPGRIYFVLRASVLGEEFLARDLGGSVSEFSIEVRAEPAFEITAPPALAFVGSAVQVDFRVVWPYATDFTLVGAYFDLAPPRAPPNCTDAFPGAVATLNVPAGAFNLTLDPPVAPGSVCFMMRALVAGIEFLSPLQYSVTAYARPTVTLTVPSWELPSSIAVVRIDVAWSEAFPLDRANIYFGPVSHGSNPDYRLYPQNGTPQAGAGRTFTFTVPLPAGTGPLYFVGVIRVDAYEFASPGEAALTVVAPPTVRTPTFSPGAGVALFGQAITVSWAVNFSVSADISADFRWDTRPHAGPAPNFADYPNASALQTKNSASTFTAVLSAPNESTTVYATVRLLLHGRNFYLANEVAIVVLPPPTLELVAYPDSVETGQPFTVVWRVSFLGDPTFIVHTAIHWGLVSKAGQPPSLTNYPGVGGPFRGNGTNLFNATLPAQTSEGHVYFIVHAVVNGLHFYLPDEFSVEVHQPAAGGGGGFLPGPDAVAALVAAAGVALGSRAVAHRRPR